MAFHRQVTLGRSSHMESAVYHVLEVNHLKSSKSKFIFFTYIIFKSNTIQHSVPSIAEIDMTSSGSGYGRHFTNSLTIIKKKKKKSKANKKKCKYSVHHDIILPLALRSTSMHKLGWFKLWKQKSV